jgi:hypothetical protein
LAAIDQYFRNMVTWLARPEAKMKLWHSQVKVAIEAAQLKEAAGPLQGARAVQDLGSMILSRLRSTVPTSSLWDLMVSGLDPSVVRSLGSAFPVPCGPPTSGLPDRDVMAAHIAGATALAILASRDENDSDEALLEQVRTGQRRGLELLTETLSTDADAAHGWGSRLLRSLT